MMRARLGLCAVLACGLAVVTPGCAPVRPWERSVLACEPMRPEARPEESRARGHMLGARESSQGATGERGGGCGCR